MEKITMLGTGHAMTLRCFNTCFVYENENGLMLVDTGGGNGLLQMMSEANINSRSIDSVFISHRHTDHVLGLPWLLRGGGRPEGLKVYLHQELHQNVTAMINALLPEALEDGRVKLIPVSDGESTEILGRKVTFIDLHAQAVTQYGFSLTMENGKNLVFCGDESLNEKAQSSVTNVGWLMHEAFSLSTDPHGYISREQRAAMGNPPPPMGPGDMPPMMGGPGAPPPKGKGKGGRHGTVKNAAETAAKLGAEGLILFHGSDRDLENRQRTYLEEASQYFSGKIKAPYDLEIIELV